VLSWSCAVVTAAEISASFKILLKKWSFCNFSAGCLNCLFCKKFKLVWNRSSGSVVVRQLSGELNVSDRQEGSSTWSLSGASPGARRSPASQLPATRSRWRDGVGRLLAQELSGWKGIHLSRDYAVEMYVLLLLTRSKNRYSLLRNWIMNDLKLETVYVSC